MWVLTQGDVFLLASFERKILRKIYGLISKAERRRIRNNREIYELYKLPDIVTPIRIARLNG